MLKLTPAMAHLRWHTSNRLTKELLGRHMKTIGCPAWLNQIKHKFLDVELYNVCIFVMFAFETNAHVVVCAVQWLGVVPRLVSKIISSRATRYIRCHPSPSPTVNVYPPCRHEGLHYIILHYTMLYYSVS